MVSVGLVSCVGGASFVVIVQRLWALIRKSVFAKISDRVTGEQRRKNCPIDVKNSDTLQGSYDAEVCPNVKLKNVRGFFTLRNGCNVFYQYWLPQDAAEVEDLRAAIVLFHGYGDECDFTQANKANILCSLGRFAVVTFDMPCFGRSDGELAYIPDWLAFVDDIREVVAEHVRPLVEGWRSKPLKLFAMGESMGGGVLFTLLVRERELFSGVVLVCPMIFVSAKLAPPWIVEQIFKHILMRLLPKWPVTPSKDLFPFCFSDPVNMDFMKSHPRHNKLNMQGKPRLITAYQLGFAGPDWMRQRIPQFDVPCLILHSAADEVTDPTISKALFDGMQGSDKELIMPPVEEGVWHADLFHGGPKHKEGCRQRFATVVKWFEARC
eukprot:TRINITY_DN13006_c0_g1_i3.p1 TRINITY_DN13006_c0_g1~~TRINITY_DN13006_c0_g1_i3.p1  ORF type:complete len:380 (-),score=59.60 TRINITY_DN13006_c0_g1_i3:110-1249(-)